MPWLSLPEGANESSSSIKNQLANTMKIRGIPTMIVLEVKTGNFVTVTGREDVTNLGKLVVPITSLAGAVWKEVETANPTVM